MALGTVLGLLAPALGGIAQSGANWMFDKFSRKGDLQAQEEAIKKGQYNMSGPSGNVTWKDNVDEMGNPTGSRTLVTSLSEPEQNKQTAQQQILNQLMGNLGEEGRQRTENAVYDRFNRFTKPEFDNERETLMARLANQGIGRGSAAYDNAMMRLDKKEQMARADLLNQSVLTGNQVYDSQIGRALSLYGGLNPQDPMSRYVGGLGGNYTNPLDNVANRRNMAQALAMQQYGIDTHRDITREGFAKDAQAQANQFNFNRRENELERDFRSRESTLEGIRRARDLEFHRDEGALNRNLHRYLGELQDDSARRAARASTTGSLISGIGSLAGGVLGSVLMPGVGTAAGAALGSRLGR